MKKLLKPSTKKKISKIVKSAKRKTKRTLTKYHIRRPRKNPEDIKSEIELLDKLIIDLIDIKYQFETQPKEKRQEIVDKLAEIIWDLQPKLRY